MMKKGGIKSRWLKNIFLLNVIIIFITCGFIMLQIYMRYYHTAEVTIKVRNTEVVDNYFAAYKNADDKKFKEIAGSFADSFQNKETMEVWVLDKNGVPVASSGNYDVSSYTDIPDYDLALESKDKSAIVKTKMPWGEHVMAMTYILSYNGGKPYGAVRYIISLKDIDKQLIFLGFIIFAAFCLVSMLVANSGYFFASTIVGPVEEINIITKKISQGDFTSRIDFKTYDDEIGDLCNNINEMAEKLGETEKLKNEFISTVSHEIRTPLTAIQGWAETLKQISRPEDEVTEKGINVILSETTRLSAMVEELLDFSRIQKGKFDIRSGVVDIIAEVNQAYLIYEPKAKKESKKLVLNCDEQQSLIVNGDNDRMCQVFINILDNAVKYTDSGGKIEVTVEKIGKYVTIIFHDNGCGISKEALQHVKEKFYKANNQVRGAGIGLAVADEIIKAHGGTLEIESEQDVGTTIKVTLTLAQENEEV